MGIHMRIISQQQQEEEEEEEEEEELKKKKKIIVINKKVSGPIVSDVSPSPRVFYSDDHFP